MEGLREDDEDPVAIFTGERDGRPLRCYSLPSIIMLYRYTDILFLSRQSHVTIGYVMIKKHK